MNETALFLLIHAFLAFLFPSLIYIGYRKEETNNDQHWFIKR